MKILSQEYILDSRVMALSFTTLAASALGFTIAMVWNDAVCKTVQSFVPTTQVPLNKHHHAQITLFYALVTTLIVIMIVFCIHHTQTFIYNRYGTPSVETLAPSDDKTAFY